MSLTRRAFAKSLLAAPVATGGLTLALSTMAADAISSPPPHAEVRIGRFTVHVLTDGYHDMPYGFFTGQPTDVTAAQAEANHVNRTGGALRLGFAQYLIEDGDRRILVDTGPAGGIGENTGKLPAALGAFGIGPDDIDAVILTHTHFDHISGAVRGDTAVYGSAEVYVDRRDIAYFTDPAARSSAPDFLLSSFDATADLVRLYPRLQRIKGDHDILLGLSTVDLTGHTPGHIGVRIEDGGQSMLIVSDMLFHPLVHPVRADIGFVFEQDPAAAEAMRARFFPLAAESGGLVAATHMPFPGLGRIGRDGDALRWVPENWAYES
ncbi:MAG: MBL fold metallo-hydrolase [Pseudomonadota bacterium]